MPTPTKIPKPVRDAIARGAASLPPIDTSTLCTVTGAQIMTDERLAKYRSSSIKEKEIYAIKKGGSIALINHIVRLENIYLTDGIKGVNKYVWKVKEHAKKMLKDQSPIIEELYQELPWYKRAFYFIMSKFKTPTK